MTSKLLLKIISNPNNVSPKNLETLLRSYGYIKNFLKIIHEI